MKLKDKVALVTGGAQGWARRLPWRWRRKAPALSSVTSTRTHWPRQPKKSRRWAGPCLGVVCDVSSVESVEKMFTQTVERFGALHILVNNAALIAQRPADTERRNRLYAAKAGKRPAGSLGITTSHTDEDWLRFWAVNVHGVFYCTRAALRLMEPQHYGKIINIASVAGSRN